MSRGACLVDSGMCGPRAQNTGLTEMWDSTTMFWKLNPWKGGSAGGAHGQWDSQICACFMKPHSQRRMTKDHRHFSTFLVISFLTNVLYVCRYDTVPPCPKRQMPLGSQEQCFYLLLSWLGEECPWSSWGSLDKEGTGVSGTSVVPPLKVLSSLTPPHPKQNPSYTGGTKPATEKLSGFLWCPECSIKNQCQ